MMYLDQITYLPDDILVKVDRASMAVSLEARVPLLDHRVVEFAWRLPLAMKVRDGEGKWLLRRVLDRYVPRALDRAAEDGLRRADRAWLRGPLRDWAEALLDAATMRPQGSSTRSRSARSGKSIVAGKGDWKHHLWGVLMLQAWLKKE